MGLASTLCLDPWQHSLHLLHILSCNSTLERAVYPGQGSCSLFRTRCTHAAAYRDDRLSIDGWSHRSVKDNLSEQRPGIPTIDRHRRNHSIFSTTTTTTITTTNTNAALETRSIWWKTVFYSRYWFALAVLPSIGRLTNYNRESRFCAAFRTLDANDDGTTNKFIKRCSFSRSFLRIYYFKFYQVTNHRRIVTKIQKSPNLWSIFNN